MKFITPLLISTSILFTFNSCKDPADATVDATVSEEAAPATSASGQKYSFTENSTIGFVGSKVTGTQEGGFKSFTGSFTVEEGEPKAGEFTIDMDSTYSDKEKLTNHLKDPDFFDVANHPNAKFVATEFKKESDTSFQLSGNLTLRGETKNITFPVNVIKDGDKVTLTSEFDINRQDFGISYPGRKDDLIRDKVIIKLNLEAKA